MQFIKTLFPAFFIWQFFSLSPFTLTRMTLRPIMNSLHAFISVISFITQSVFMLYGLFNFEYYVDFEDRTFIMSAGDMLSMTLVRCTSISIVLESWLKRSHQIEFLRKIDQIDAILNTNLLINLRYTQQHKRNVLQLIAWIGLYSLLEIAMVVTIIINDMKVFQLYWTIYTIPLFLCMARYQQFITYVNLLHDRYAAINEYVSRLSLHRHKDSKNLETLTKANSAQGCKPWHRISDFEALIVINKLKHLQHTQRLLVEANKKLCYLFGWSMLLNVSNDFLNLLINIYWLIINFIHGDSKLELIGILSWGFFNGTMLVLVSTACHFASYEVVKASKMYPFIFERKNRSWIFSFEFQGTKFSALIHSIDLANTSPDLDYMVCSKTKSKSV